MSSAFEMPPYRVELGASALSQLGSVPAEVFQRLRNELEQVAGTLDTEGGAGNRLRALKVGAFAAVYEVDPRSRAIRLLGITGT